MTRYPYEERDKVYPMLEKIEELSDLVERIGTGLSEPNPDLQAVLANMTGATDLKRQHESLTYLHKTIKERHMNRIFGAARDDFSAFVEAINPGEPCRSKVHRFLAGHLMDMDANRGMKTAISMPPGHAKDLCVETPILLGDGSQKRLGDIEVGDFVITHTGAAREVVEVHEQGVRDILTLTTAMGRVINAHPDHPFLTPAGWIPAKDLVPGDVLAQQREFAIENTSGRTREEFALAGYLMAYGFVRNRVYSRIREIDLRFRCDDPVILEDVISLAKNLGYSGRVKMGISYKEEVRTLTFGDPFEFWLRNQGLWRADRISMRVPDWVFKGSLMEISAFVGAVFSMDATLTPKRSKHTGAQRQISIRLRNAGLCRDMQNLFMRMGARSGLTRSIERCYNYEPTKFWNLTVHHDEDIALLRKNLRIIGTNRRVWDQPIAVRRFFDARYGEDTIVGIEAGDPTETRCLTVEIDHSFLADGIVVHNSTYGSRLFPAWWMGRRENKKWLQAGHTQKFAEKEFGKKTRDQILETPAYAKIFDVVVRSASVDEIIMSNDTSYVVKGVGQGISGYRSHFNNIDDPYPTEKSAQSPVTRETVWHWWTNDFRTRRLPGAGELIIVTRWHSDDIVGRLEEMLAEEANTMGAWTIINLPAFSLGPDVDQLSRPEGEPLWPEFFTKKELLDLKGPMQESRWQSLYQGSPVLSEGNILQRKWLKHYTDPPQLHKARDPKNYSQVNRIGDPENSGRGPEESLQDNSNPISKNPFRRVRIVISVDSAEKDTVRADFSSIQAWCLATDRKHYLLDNLTAKMEFPKLIESIENMARKWGADAILVETKGAGNQYIQARTGHAPCSIIPYNPGRDDKSIRFEGTMAMWEAGEVLLPERAVWLPKYEDELLRFPSAKHDDQVDATSQYLNWSRADGGWRRGTKKVRG